MKAFKQFNAKDTEVVMLQNNLISYFVANFKSGTIGIDGLKLENIVLKAGSNKIEHKLNRKLQGWIPLWIPAAVTVYPTARDEKYITLVTSGDVTIDLWVF